MSFEKADEAIHNITIYSSKNESIANVEAIKALCKTIESAQESMTVMVATPVIESLQTLNKAGKETSEGVSKLTNEMSEFRQSMDKLNSNLKNFDEQATKLGRTANVLASVLALAAIIQAGATLWQVFGK
jgi:uncharacterized coiled-coil DUF342 family protein